MDYSATSHQHQHQQRAGVTASSPLVTPTTHDGAHASLHEHVGVRRRAAASMLAPGASFEDGPPLLAEAARGDVRAVLARLDTGGDPYAVHACDSSGQRALHHACARGHVGVVEALLSRGAECEARDRRGRAALHEASANGHAACVRALLDAFKTYAAYYGGGGSAMAARKVDVNVRDATGATALHCATERKVIEMLLREGADGSMRRGDGSNALHLACDRGCGWACEALLGCGTDCDARDGVGRTALHRARDARCVRALCASGADVDAVSDDGYVPLHVAAMEGKPECVTPLVDAGANIRARTRKRGQLLPGATAADLAAKFGHDDVVRLLENAKQISRVNFLSMCAINHNEERYVKQMKRASEKRYAVVWGALVAIAVVLIGLLCAHFWFAGAKHELEEWRKLRAKKEQIKLEKARLKENAAKAELKRKAEIEAAARAWKDKATSQIERILRCGVQGTVKDGVKKGGVHRCVLFGADGKGVLSEAGASACAACVDFLQELRERLAKGSTDAAIDAQLTSACERAQGRTVKVCDALLAQRRDVTRQMSFVVEPAKICERVGKKDPELCAVKPPVEGELSSDGKGDAAARDAFRRLSVFVHPDKHENSAHATESFKLLNTARKYMDAKATLKAKKSATVR